MIYQLQQHIVTTFGAKQGIFPEAFEEALGEGFGWQHAIASCVSRRLCRDNICEVLPHFLVTNISVKSIISNSLEPLWQDVLYHSSDESQDSNSFMFDPACFVITVPVADGLAIVAFNASYRDRWRDNILCQILRQSLSTWWYLTILQKSDQAPGIFSPGPVNVFFNVWVGYIFPQHFQEVVLPFFVHHLVGDIIDRFPLAFFVKSAGGHKDMEVRVIMAGTSCGLQDDDIADVEFDASAGIENIFDTGMSCSHEWTEQFRVVKEPYAEELRYGQYYMAIRDTWQESSSDEVSPAVGIDLGTGKTKAGFAGESNSTYLSALAASVLNKAHLFRITAVKHFLDSFVVVRTVKVWAELFERIPVIIKYLLECVFIDAFHGCSLRTTITEMAK